MVILPEEKYHMFINFPPRCPRFPKNREESKIVMRKHPRPWCCQEPGFCPQGIQTHCFFLLVIPTRWWCYQQQMGMSLNSRNQAVFVSWVFHPIRGSGAGAGGDKAQVGKLKAMGFWWWVFFPSFYWHLKGTSDDWPMQWFGWFESDSSALISDEFIPWLGGFLVYGEANTKKYPRFLGVAKSIEGISRWWSLPLLPVNPSTDRSALTYDIWRFPEIEAPPVIIHL